MTEIKKRIWILESISDSNGPIWLNLTTLHGWLSSFHSCHHQIILMIYTNIILHEFRHILRTNVSSFLDQFLWTNAQANNSWSFPALSISINLFVNCEFNICAVFQFLTGKKSDCGNREMRWIHGDSNVVVVFDSALFESSLWLDSWNGLISNGHFENFTQWQQLIQWFDAT